MDAKQKLHQVYLQKWAARFPEQKASGLTIRQWCEVNHLSFHTYNSEKESSLRRLLFRVVLSLMSNIDRYQITNAAMTIAEVIAMYVYWSFQTNGSFYLVFTALSAILLPQFEHIIAISPLNYFDI